jgi:hypothetical protein
MRTINKNLPIVALQALKTFIQSLDMAHVDLFHMDSQDHLLFRVVDNDKGSGFYFNIEQFDNSNGLLIKYKPSNRTNTTDNHTWARLEEIGTYFKIWHDCLKELNDLDEFYKDPFLKNLEDQFLADFDLSEENKKNGLTIRQIYSLEESLSKIQNELPEYSGEISASTISQVVEETAYIKSELAKQTQEWVAKKLSAVLAKITHESPGILKSLFKEFGKQLMSQGVKFLIEHGDKLI